MDDKYHSKKEPQWLKKAMDQASDNRDLDNPLRVPIVTHQFKHSKDPLVTIRRSELKRLVLMLLFMKPVELMKLFRGPDHAVDPRIVKNEILGEFNEFFEEELEGAL